MAFKIGAKLILRCCTYVSKSVSGTSGWIDALSGVSYMLFSFSGSQSGSSLSLSVHTSNFRQTDRHTYVQRERKRTGAVRVRISGVVGVALALYPLYVHIIHKNQESEQAGH